MLERISEPVVQILIIDGRVILGKTFSGLDLLVQQVSIKIA